MQLLYHLEILLFLMCKSNCLQLLKTWPQLRRCSWRAYKNNLEHSSDHVIFKNGHKPLKLRRKNDCHLCNSLHKWNSRLHRKVDLILLIIHFNVLLTSLFLQLCVEIKATAISKQTNQQTYQKYPSFAKIINTIQHMLNPSVDGNFPSCK